MSHAQRKSDYIKVKIPTPDITLAACLETAGLWCAVLLVGVLLIFSTLLVLQYDAIQNARQERVTAALDHIKQQVEEQLAFGAALQDLDTVQSLLNRAQERDPGLLSVEIFNPSGLSLFNTDRASVGEYVPSTWKNAQQPLHLKQKNVPYWRVKDAYAEILGVDIQGDPNQEKQKIKGSIVALINPNIVLDVSGLLFSTVVLLVLMFALVWFVTHYLLKRIQWAGIDPSRIQDGKNYIERLHASLNRALHILQRSED